MPELPEVETCRRGIAPHITDQKITDIIIRQPQLRWPVPNDLLHQLYGQTITAVKRRGKYLCLTTRKGTLIIHLGMSGRLRIIDSKINPNKHDHVDFIFNATTALRFTDPRRFGAILWASTDPYQHPLLAKLGKEPLQDDFDGHYLWRCAKGRRVTIKQFIMDNKIVVGVGNIYASEALFAAGIHPQRAAGKIAKSRLMKLASVIKEILQKAIDQGGTTLRDFLSSEGNPGYFRQQLNVYGRQGLPCKRCATTLQLARLGQRASVFCPRCQR